MGRLFRRAQSGWPRLSALHAHELICPLLSDSEGAFLSQKNTSKISMLQVRLIKPSKVKKDVKPPCSLPNPPCGLLFVHGSDSIRYSSGNFWIKGIPLWTQASIFFLMVVFCIPFLSYSFPIRSLFKTGNQNLTPAHWYEFHFSQILLSETYIFLCLR